MKLYQTFTIISPKRSPNSKTIVQKEIGQINMSKETLCSLVQSSKPKNS